jgi:peptide/nickel transport system substrate-binding protein
MKHLAPALLLGICCLSLPTFAQTLRWASQGDALTMDPHSQNEGLTNNINGQIHESLVRRDRHLALVPGLATRWQQTGPLTWRFTLRSGVQFHDGAPLTADDVVFSVQRAQRPQANIAVYANALGSAHAIDAQTVEFRLAKVNPIFLQHLDGVFIMNRAWAEKHRVTVPLDFKNREESFASFNANGTGPYRLVQRQPGIKTVLRRNDAWWGWADRSAFPGAAPGNVQEVVFTPVANDATRLAALVSGELDLVLDPAPRDIPRLRATPGIRIIEGPENRVLFVGMDQFRDGLLHGNVKDKNPFKDRRVRQALAHAVDIEAIRSKLMSGLALPTGAVWPSPLAVYNDTSLETRPAFDLAKARALMAEAGWPEGFEVTMDCPNNRYVNDEEICLALAAMWSQIKLKVRVNAMPRALWFPKMEKFDTSLFLLGWGGAVTDAEPTITALMRHPAPAGVGLYNWGRVKNDRFEALAVAQSVEPDPKKREDLVKAALREYKEQMHLVPLHRQLIPWAVRARVEAVHRADNWLETAWITLK